jgi:hypothetical protein
MKFWIIILLTCGIFFYFFVPPVNKERQCYAMSQRDLDQISVNLLDKRLSKETLCSARSDVLFNLETCIRDATKSGSIALYANDTVQSVVAMVRQSRITVWTLKVQHNEECAEFRGYLLP